MNLPGCTYKAQAQDKKNVAPSHDGETVTFRNSVGNENHCVPYIRAMSGLE